MTAPVKQHILDHVPGDGEGPVADPNQWLVDDDWRWVGFEYGGAR